MGTAVPERPTKRICHKKVEDISGAEGRECKEIVECMFVRELHGTQKGEGEGRILAKEWWEK